ncbi:hypothetical protein RDWZM_004781 [Blomia tropicalis]|uniref:Uncharacterized protein n=1 Tax=Blomia tropicalis TaxID=40697 RepID=A0A9Q0M4X8_BLOTA|nr:hypothetical protein RDWZM_004781 [Blomia tropicalis]
MAGNFRPKLEATSIGNKSKGKFLENSPIFFLKIGSSSTATNIQHHTKGINLKPIVSGNNVLFGKRNSNLYKLPLQFISNAKPVDIIQGINKLSNKVTYNNNNNKKKKPMVNKVFKHGSKIFYLPTRFVSNGKPIKPVLLSSMGKRIVQQIGVNQINHHQQQQPMSIYLKKKKFYHKY